MAFPRLLQEARSRRFTTFLRDVAFENFAFVIDQASQVVRITIDLHIHPIKMPPPMAELAHPADPLARNVGGEEWAKPVLPQMQGLMAKVDPALIEPVFDIPQRQREPHIHHDHQADHFG